MSITGVSGSGKTNVLLNLIKEKDHDELVEKIYLNAKDFNKPKYQLLIRKREEAGMYVKDTDPKAFTQY